jgi:hypothetical protein
MKTFLSIIKTTASVVGVLLLAAVFIEGSYWIRAPHDQADDQWQRLCAGRSDAGADR